MSPLGLMPAQLAAPATGPKRILAIEGGGVRGKFSLEILARIESLLRERTQRHDLVLADHYHLIAGSSVGALFATGLSWGWSVEKLRDVTDRHMADIFTKSTWLSSARAVYRRGPLKGLLQHILQEEDGSPALFGTRLLRTWLLIIVRNLSTGSAWPLLNHPESKYNRLVLPDGRENLASNLRIPLWQLVRGSTAAPWYFPPERVDIAPGTVVEFVDGGVTAYNNPSLIAYLMATLPAFPLRWEKGVNKIHVISVGTGRSRARLSPLQRLRFRRIRVAGKMPGAMIDAASLEQDLVMRTIGRCLYGEAIDAEIGTLAGDQAVGDAFSYCRYNRTFAEDEIHAACRQCRTKFSLDSVRLASWLSEQGKDYAREAVRIEHLDP